MKKIYSFFIAMAMIATCASAAKAQTTTTYAGTIDITMMDQSLAEDSPANVQITATDEGTCTFMLPDFEVALTPGAQPMPLGDIVVENVSMTTENGTTSYEGAVEDLVLSMAGVMEIHASVEISGTTTDAGAANMTINVIWNADYPENTQQIPIGVTFTAPEGSATVGVESIAADGVAAVYGTRGAISVNGYEGRVDIYSIAGQLVNSQVIGNGSLISMLQGVYIVKLADKAVKVIVK